MFSDIISFLMKKVDMYSKKYGSQNHRQKVFNRGVQHFCGGLNTQKINKNSIDL